MPILPIPVLTVVAVAACALSFMLGRYQPSQQLVPFDLQGTAGRSVIPSSQQQLFPPAHFLRDAGKSIASPAEPGKPPLWLQLATDKRSAATAEGLQFESDRVFLQNRFLFDYGTKRVLLPIDRVPAASLDPLTFLHKYVLKNRPVVLTNCTHSSRASRKWSDEFMAATAGDAKVLVGKASGHDDLLQFNTNETATVEMTFREFLHTYRGGATRTNLLYMHPNSPSLKLEPVGGEQRHLEGAKRDDHWTEMNRDFDLPAFADYMPRLDRSTLWIGAANTSTATHFDAHDNVLSIVSLLLVASSRQY